ncbi:hypothetical protein, partial [Massilia genomosp. 1]|uniref:hypothetical protein n=1 Tax=Massilia genomosp. 1 TaxID=2609280 RepID=UPI001C9E5C74
DDGTPQSRKKCHGSRHQKGEKSSTQKSSVKIVFRRQLACKFPYAGTLPITGWLGVAQPQSYSELKKPQLSHK